MFFISETKVFESLMHKIKNGSPTLENRFVKVGFGFVKGQARNLPTQFYAPQSSELKFTVSVMVLLVVRRSTFGYIQKCILFFAFFITFTLPRKIAFYNKKAIFAV
jgi:hypothetical protein